MHVLPREEMPFLKAKSRAILDLKWSGHEKAYKWSVTNVLSLWYTVFEICLKRVSFMRSENVNFVKNETLKIWILSKMRIWKCEFLDKMWIFAPVWSDYFLFCRFLQHHYSRNGTSKPAGGPSFISWLALATMLVSALSFNFAMLLLLHLNPH